jgi:hypothetical protein
MRGSSFSETSRGGHGNLSLEPELVGGQAVGGEGIMASDKECVDHARECVRLAGLAQDAELRERLLNIAREWMATAMHERFMPDIKPLTAARQVRCNRPAL